MISKSAGVVASIAVAVGILFSGTAAHASSNASPNQTPPEPSSGFTVPWSAVYGEDKTYYSTPHVKQNTGTVSVKVTDLELTDPCGTSCYGGALHVGMRNQSGRDEDSAYPATPTGSTTKLKNIRNNSYNWGPTTYYMNAEYEGTWKDQAYRWRGSVIFG